MKETLLGRTHPELAPTLNNLAVLARADGRDPEAERLYQRALSCLECAVESTHPSLTSCLENYAALLDEIGRHGEANTLRVRAQTRSALAGRNAVARLKRT